MAGPVEGHLPSLQQRVFLYDALVLSVLWSTLSVSYLPHAHYIRLRRDVMDFIWMRGCIIVAYDVVIGPLRLAG